MGPVVELFGEWLLAWNHIATTKMTKLTRININTPSKRAPLIQFEQSI